MPEIDRENEQFNQGVTHTVDLLAKLLGVSDWVAGDGSEDYDDDLSQTLLNILKSKRIYDDEGFYATLPAPEVGKVERHPGPYLGPDVELARACAVAVIPFYGNDDEITHQRIMKSGIWNDHIAVQSALAAIHNLKTPST